MQTTLVYDGTFDGFLSSVFAAFKLKLKEVSIVKELLFQEPLFGNWEAVITDQEKANRVWDGLKKKLSANELRRFYYAFLSEKPGVENTMYHAMKYVFTSQKRVGSDFGNEYLLELSKLTKSVGREKHRMEAFIRFN